MKWRDPKNELPKEGEKVWVFIAPHKDRGHLKESVMSTQILCGVASHSRDLSSCRVENEDELGRGNISWYLSSKLNVEPEEKAIAWIPIDELTLPQVSSLEK